MSLVKMESKSSRMYDPDIPDPVSYDLKMASVSTEGDNNAKQRRNKKKREGLTDYSEHASMHGISYVFERDIVVISRVFWFITSLTLAALATYWIVAAYMAWQDDPVITNVRTTGHPIDNLDFPAITICGLGMIEATLNRAFSHQVDEFLKRRNMSADWVFSNDSRLEAENLLIESGLYDDFIGELYPGLQRKSPLDVVTLISSRNPDMQVRSEFLQFGYDPCSEQKYNNTSWTGGNFGRRRKKRATVSAVADNLTIRCPSGTVYEETEEVCYGLGVVPAAGYDGLGDACSTLEGDSFEITSDEQLTGLINLIQTGQLPELEMGNITFWTFGYAIDDELLVTGEGVELTPANFSSIQLQSTTPNPDNLCIGLRYLDTTEKFEVIRVDCEDENLSTLCVNAPEITFNCSAGQENNITAVGGGEENEGGRSRSNVLDNMLNPEIKKKQKKSLVQIKKSYRDAYRGIDMEKSFPSLFELLWYTQMPCFDVEGITSDRAGERSLLKQCRWKSKEIKCSAIFKMFPTDRGMCCTFNLEAAENIFNDGQYKESLTNLQAKNKKYAFESTKLPKWFTEDSEPTPEPGISNGLTVVLDAHTDLIRSGTVREDFQGFIATIATRGEYPLTNQKHIRIRPGHDNLVALTAVDVETDHEIRENDLDKRNCKFYDEAKLRFHQNYTQANCLLECNLEFARTNLEAENLTACTPWYLPTSDHNIKMCDPWAAAKFNRYFDNVPKGTCKHCLPDCESTSYDASITALPFRRCDNKNMGVSEMCNLQSKVLSPPIFGSELQEEYKKILEMKRNGETVDYATKKYPSSKRSFNLDTSKELFSYSSKSVVYDAYEKDIATAHFYFEKSTVFQFHRRNRMGPVDFASKVGGLLGLCLGFSICSMVEIAYWLLFRIWCSMKRQPAAVDPTTDEDD